MPLLKSSPGEGIFGKQNPQAVWEASRLLKFVGRSGSVFPTSPESLGRCVSQEEEMESEGPGDYSCFVQKQKQKKSLPWDLLAFLLKKKREISYMDFFF